MAHAQRPICAPPGPDERVHAICTPFSLFPAVRFLADFTVDQLFKPAPPPFTRSLLEFGQLFAVKEIAASPPLKDFLAVLAPLRFAQLDRTTGTVFADFDAGRKEFDGELAGVAGQPAMTLRLPRHLQGGYWRGPDVLQVAFWEHGRMGVRITHEGGRVFEGEVECAALSPDGLLVRFEPAVMPPLLVQFRECEQ